MLFGSSGSCFPETTIRLSKPGPPGMDDYVLYFSCTCDEDARDYRRLERAAMAEARRLDPKATRPANHMDVSVKLGGESPDVRALACRCGGGQYWSLACRQKLKSGQVYGVKTDYVRCKEVASDVKDSRAWKANSEFKWPHFTTVDDLVRPLYELIFHEGESDAHGLILITGSTGAAKSQVGRGLLYRYLEKQLELDPYPTAARKHVVVIEKPLESKFLKDVDDPKIMQVNGLDFTQRLYTIDTDSVQDALTDTLRQKPYAVYLDEVRNAKEWKDVMRFAGSGHLIVTTAHAAGLVEAMRWIMDSVDADTPADRETNASRILGLVHMGKQVWDSIKINELDKDNPIKLSDLVDDKTKRYSDVTKQIEVPFLTLWRNKPNMINALVADGYGSILPGNPRPLTGPDLHLRDDGSFGRTWFMRRLISDLMTTTVAPGRARMIHFLEELYEHAIVRDTEGM